MAAPFPRVSVPNYWPSSRKVFCLSCGDADYRTFLESASDEEFYQQSIRRYWYGVNWNFLLKNLPGLDAMLWVDQSFHWKGFFRAIFAVPIRRKQLLRDSFCLRPSGCRAIYFSVQGMASSHRNSLSEDTLSNRSCLLELEFYRPSQNFYPPMTIRSMLFKLKNHLNPQSRFRFFKCSIVEA